MTPFTIRLSGPITDVRPKQVNPLFDFIYPPSGPYFNTTNETGETLATYRAKAAEQEEHILAVMQWVRVASPSQLHAAMGKNWPLTSVRRAMTNLTNADKLEKMEHKIIGPFGRREHCWKIVTP